MKFDDCSKPSNESWEALHSGMSIALNKTGRPILLELDGGYSLPVNGADPYQPKYGQAWKVQFLFLHVFA